MPPLAHELWFVDDVPPRDWAFAAEPATLLLLAAAVALTLAVRLVARRRPGIDLPVLARLAPWMPFAVRTHLAVSLVGLLSGGGYLAPNLELEDDVVGVLLGILMAVIAFLLFTGWHTRRGALLLVLSGPVGMLAYSPDEILQRVDLLGLALYLLLTGGGRWSADAELGRAPDPSPLTLARAVLALRVCVDAALIWVAFVEKLANPDLAQAFLDAQAVDLNVAQALGLPVGDVDFIRIAGAIEVLFGLLLISGALPQAVVLAAGIPFNATLYFFGTIELLGHLPIYAAMLVLLVYGSHPELRATCSTFRSPRTRSARRDPESLSG